MSRIPLDPLSLEVFNQSKTQDVYQFLQFVDTFCGNIADGNFETNDLPGEDMEQDQDGLLDLGSLFFDQNHDQYVDAKDFSLYKENLAVLEGWLNCKEEFPQGVTVSTYIRAHRLINRHLMERDVLPLFKEKTTLQISSEYDWENDPILKLFDPIIAKLEPYQILSFFTIVINWIAYGVITKEEDLLLKPNTPLSRLLVLYDDKQIATPRDEAYHLGDLIRSKKDLENLERFLNYLEPEHHDFIFYFSSHEFLQESLEQDPPLTEQEFKINFAYHLMDLSFSQTYFDGAMIKDPNPAHLTFFKLLSDPILTLAEREKIVAIAIQHLQQEEDNLHYGEDLSFLTMFVTLDAREAAALREEFFQAFLDEAVKREKSDYKYLSLLSTLQNSFSDMTKSEQERVLNLFTGIIAARGKHFKLVVWWMLLVIGETQKEKEVYWQTKKEEALAYFNARKIEVKNDENGFLDLLNLQHDVVFRYFSLIAAHYNLGEVRDLLVNDYDYIPEERVDWSNNWSLAFDSTIDEIWFFRILKANPDILRSLGTQRAKNLYKKFKNELGPLKGLNTYEFYQLTEFTRRDQGKTWRFHKKIKEAFPNFEITGVDAFRYLQELSDLNNQTQRILLEDLKPLLGQEEIIIPSTLYFHSQLAKEDEVTREAVIKVILPWTIKKGLAVIWPNDLILMINIAKWLKTHDRNLNDGLYEEALAYTGKDKVSLHDFYFYLRHKDRLIKREELIARLQTYDLQEIHRQDDNFNFYEEDYGNWENFSTIDLMKMFFFLSEFLTSYRRSLGTLFDYEMEIGFAPYFNDNDQAILERFVWGHPFANLTYERRYHKTFEHALLDPIAIGMVHTHPQPGYEGPSAGLKSDGMFISPAGDLFTRRDGFVVSEMENNQFALHFYDTEGNVMPLGIYQRN